MFLKNVNSMIDAKELRIGNWFYIGELIGQANADSFKNTDIFDPIPLTKEILVKCGFINSNNNRLAYIKNIILICGDKEFKNKITFYHDRCSTNIEYVHQLQNLYYALTQTELKIEL